MIIDVQAMDWRASHCRPIAQQSAKIVTARAMHQSTHKPSERRLTRQLLERFRNRKIVSEMNDLVFVSIVVTGFTVAFLHAAIPTHWLPFVVAARAQHWNKPKTLAITGVAGAGHVIFTIALGVLVVWGGMAINSRIGKVFPLIAGGALIVLGLFYLVRQIRGKGHSHLFGSHSHHDHEHDSHEHHMHSHAHAHEHEHDDDMTMIEQRWSHRRSDWVVIAGLFALLTFSPCEAFLPVFLIGAKYGWAGFALLAAILAIATVAGMVVFTWITLAGVEKLKLSTLEKFESGVLGGVLCLLGLLIILFER
jgi:ABC-type nickel/cobalt efflux system permease component RcnA